MSTVAFIRRMLEAGFTHDDALRAAEAFEATMPGDAQAERRRAKDRERKRLRNSAESAEVVEPLSPSPPPQTPPPRPHTREEIYTPRARASDFEAFWQAYPAKIGKKAAETAWAKAKDRPPLDEVLAAIDRYRRAKPPDRDWCHPSTWLNQGRWSDEAPPPTTPAERPRNDRFADQAQPRSDRVSRMLAGAVAAADGP